MYQSHSRYHPGIRTHVVIQSDASEYLFCRDKTQCTAFRDTRSLTKWQTLARVVLDVSPRTIVPGKVPRGYGLTFDCLAHKLTILKKNRSNLLHHFHQEEWMISWQPQPSLLHPQRIIFTRIYLYRDTTNMTKPEYRVASTKPKIHQGPRRCTWENLRAWMRRNCVEYGSSRSKQDKFKQIPVPVLVPDSVAYVEAVCTMSFVKMEYKKVNVKNDKESILVWRRPLDILSCSHISPYLYFKIMNTKISSLSDHPSIRDDIMCTITQRSIIVMMTSNYIHLNSETRQLRTAVYDGG